jgi:hypothetical protein
MDNFAAFVIYLALRIAACHPDIPIKEMVDDQYLIFKKDDFLDLGKSKTAMELVGKDPRWQQAIDKLLSMCQSAPSACPPLSSAVARIPFLDPAHLDGSSPKETEQCECPLGDGAVRVALSPDSARPRASMPTPPEPTGGEAPMVSPSGQAVLPTETSGVPATRSAHVATFGCILGFLGMLTGGPLAVVGLALSVAGVLRSPPGAKRAVLGIVFSMVGIAYFVATLAILLADRHFGKT